MANNKFTLHIDGSPYEVERRGDLMVVNGVEFPFVMKDGQPVVAGTLRSVKIDGVQAEVDGIQFTIRAEGLEEPKVRKGRADKAKIEAVAGAVTAIMPGLIIKVLKGVGDSVEAGETILVLEAMKMQNDIQAKASGTIKTMLVKQGDNVEGKQVLCVIE